MKVLNGDCRDLFANVEDASVDSIVTDPPYELGFMGKAWDASGIAYDESVWRESLRVLKPGGHLLAFGGSRTYHRMACAIEDAGFEVRDQIMWLYGSGFPKSHNLGTGWGTALKPAHEPVVVARKPFRGTVAANVTEHGTGAINIDDCRIGTTVESWPSSRSYGSGSPVAMTSTAGEVQRSQPTGDAPAGRWPANVILDEEAGALLDEQSGERGAAAPASGPTHSGPSKSGSMAGAFSGMGDKAPVFHADKGGASRFFYCAKASKRERSAGVATNHHPTVKPIDLMRYLVRLVTPPGGLVLDPFTGSGTTGIAAVLEGMEFLGFEQDEEYARIADARIGFWQKDQQMNLDLGLAA